MLTSHPASDKAHRRREPEEVGCLLRQDLQAYHESKYQSMALKILASERAARPLDARDEIRGRRPLVVQLPAQNWTCESMILLFDSRVWAGHAWRLVAVFRKKNHQKTALTVGESKELLSSVFHITASSPGAGRGGASWCRSHRVFGTSVFGVRVGLLGWAWAAWLKPPPASQGAAAGIGSARGLGASPTPDLRESARAVPPG
jgi:hypothetical protein